MTKEKIERILREHLAIERLEIQDDSLMHANHAEAKKSGGGHFSILIISKDFVGKSSLERHRMIYTILKNEFGNEIHALRIKALTPVESQNLRS